MNIPNSQNQNFSVKVWYILTTLFLIIILAHIPILWARTDAANDIFQGLVPTCCDDSVYQIPAINMLYGKGFSQSFSVPFDQYHLIPDTPYIQAQKNLYERNGVEAPIPDFHRAPGFPVLLTLTYAAFGNNPINARRMLAMQGIITALLLYFTGIMLNKWSGVIAGGLTAIYFLNFQPGLIQPLSVSYASLTTEAPTSFWIALFCFAFVWYLKNNRPPFLVVASLALAWAIFTRANLLTALPILVIYLLLTRHKVTHIALLVIITIAPLILWSIYASLSVGKFVPFTTQSDSLFAETNNIEMIQGSIQNSPGDWSPGYARDEKGNTYITYANDPKPGESGWMKGLTFWRDNLSSLPVMFYIKMYAGFWNNYGFSVNPLQPERFHLLGIGFLIAMLGLRMPKRRPKSFASAYSGLTIAVLLFLLFIFGNHISFLAVLFIWLVILFLALARPYGNIVNLDFVPPTWFLAFVGSHLITTLIFYGIRFHWPLDAPLMLFGLMGSLGLAQLLIARKSRQTTS